MDALERYQTSVKTAMKAAWTPPTMADFEQGLSVISFDQSLAATGWAYLAVEAGEVDVRARGTLRTASGMKGWWGNFDRAHQFASLLAEVDTVLMRGRAEGAPRWPGAVVLEMPAVQGQRTDSSMLAAYEIDRFSVHWWTPTVLVSIQRSRTILGGSAIRNDKKGGHEALARYIPESATRQWNEHQRDAAINGLAHLYTLKQENTDE